jgi:hypothetical protein
VVVEVDCGKASVGNDILGTKAQGEYCLVTMSVRNIGNEAQTFVSGDQKAFASSTEYTSDVEATLYANDDANAFLKAVNPGNQLKSVIVVFDVPQGTKLTHLELHGSSMSGGVRVDL